MTPAKTTRATPITLIVFFLMTSWAAAGCLGPLDALGYESGEYERESLFREPEIQDDRIEDKDPSYDPSSRVEELFGTCQVVMNKSGTVTKLDIVPFEEDNADLEERLFPTRAEALVEVGSRGRRRDHPLSGGDQWSHEDVQRRPLRLHRGGDARWHPRGLPEPAGVPLRPG